MKIWSRVFVRLNESSPPNFSVTAEPPVIGERQTFYRMLPLALAVIVVLLLFIQAPPTARAFPEEQEESPTALKQLSLEELINIEITSVSKKAEKLSETAAAVYVITQEDIRRSGATSIAEALRMAPGVQVARIDSSTWAISARGFNSQYANKLLVLMDGRSVYTPLFSGVNWELQDTMIEDIERIEVIRGPGASVWGANAVNGVINIITKHARDTQGGLFTTQAGNEELIYDGIRYGGAINDNAWYRVYAKFKRNDNSDLADGRHTDDGWKVLQGGFHIDWDLSETDTFTFQGDSYEFDGDSMYTAPTPPFTLFDNDTETRGSNILGRWRRTLSDSSVMTAQIYYDRVDINKPVFPRVHDTIDLELQHEFSCGESHDIVWGIGYRTLRESVDNTIFFAITPDSRHDSLISAFVQDDITMAEDLMHVTVGSKVEHNDYTGFEVQPTLRCLWTPHEKHSVWASVSHAVRTPSIIESGDRANVGLVGYAPNFLPPFNLLPVVSTMTGNRDLDSEDLMAYELGYRVQPTERLSLDAAAFYNNYDDLRTLELVGTAPDAIPPTFYTMTLNADNKMTGRTYGAELAADWQAAEWWRLRGAYTFLQIQLDPATSSRDVPSEDAEGESPHNQVSLRSLMDISETLEFDTGIRYVGRLSSLDVGNYVGLDLRLGWKPVEDLEISLVGQNLTRRKHTEFEPFFNTTETTEVEQSIYVRLTYRF